MRRAASFLIPTAIITLYYLFWMGLLAMLLARYPAAREFFPVGGLGDLVGADTDSFEPVYSHVEETVLAPHGPFRLALASIGAAVLILPVSWVYFITSRTKEVDSSFVQTIVIMPIVVTGISMIVLNSLALAFSLAGIVAAVRFRFSLDQPSHAMYIFVAISIGLGAGIGALGVAMVISMAFVYAMLIIWKLQYGKIMSGPFFSLLTRRSRSEEDY
ncbi:MAG: phospholipid carrier-dependent glycosyltransferase [Woeseia sp.]|nr:phospholipid carrier-dependent glycosyltransferase [Woeseia sp.]MBT8096466.1 phospholipid carrier-dependent glycosyltransferase [Woeseia sp.]NNE62109.1 phospholipid carrier-dependent glycosyltransferase [Woeseia sp.]NNL55313.1 phospholipid carrier-dependent glycosyltransferase [Woeseia sp.]